MNSPRAGYCPAHVYEIIEIEKNKPKLQQIFRIVCTVKRRDIKDPYQNINWVPPEGGDGPKLLRDVNYIRLLKYFLCKKKLSSLLCW